MKRIIVKNIFILILFFIFCGAISCGSSSASANDEEKGIDSDASSAIAVTQVATTVAESRSFQYFINSNGKIKSIREQLINTETGGKLIFCSAKTGAFFLSGALLAKFETAPILFRLERAKLAHYNSSKEFESQLLGYESLLKGKNKEEADAIRQKLKISTGLAGAEQDIKEAEYELLKAVITAPFSGVVANVKVQQGQLVKPGQELFRIYDPTQLLLEIKVLESDVALLQKGMMADVFPLAAPEKKYAAIVYEVNPYVDENGMVLVKLKIMNSALSTSKTGNESLFPGMNCTATIKIPSVKSIIVPKEAVVQRDGRYVVFTIEEGKAKWNYVTTGRDNGQELEVKDGLKPGMKVIFTNNLQLAHDAPVVEEKSPPLSQRK